MDKKSKEFIFAIVNPKARIHMKKIFSLFFILALLLCVLTGCDDSASSSEEIYKIEFGAITKDTYNTAMDKLQNIKNINYNEINSIRNYLYQNTLSDYEIVKNVYSVDIEEFIKSRGFSDYQISTEMNFLEKNGNDILFFEHAIDANKRVWMYITK